jgi:hypothetical protein
MTRILLEVTDLDTKETRYITVTGGTEVPDLVAGYALRYARQFAGLPTEAVPQRIAWFRAGEEDAPEDDAA